MADTPALLARLMRAAEDDPTIYAALQQYYQGSAPLDEVLVDCILILSAQLREANQALADNIARNANPHWHGQ